MDKQKKNKKFLESLLFVSAIFLVLLSFLILTSSEKKVSVEVIAISVEIGDTLGLNILDDELNFGTLMAGQSATKILKLSNGFSVPLKVKISLDSGNITSFIYGENNLILQPQEQIDYEVSLVIPRDSENGFYEGNIIIEFFK